MYYFPLEILQYCFRLFYDNKSTMLKISFILYLRLIKRNLTNLFIYLPH